MKFALRQLLKSPGFTFIAVLTLAIGIGANTAILTSTALLLTAIAIASCWLPALRASRSDPMIALRAE